MRFLLVAILVLCVAAPSLATQDWVLLTSRRTVHDMQSLYEFDVYLVGSDWARRLTSWPGPEGEAVYSPRLGKVVFTGMKGSDFHLWAVSLDGQDPCRLTASPWSEGKPTLSPDGGRVAYPTLRENGYWSLACLDLASGDEEILLDLGANVVQPEWSPRGDSIAFVTDLRANLDVYLLDLATGAARPVADGPTSEREPDWSPDGGALCYTVRKGNGAEIFLHDLATGANRQLTSFGAFSREASFTPDGKGVVFVSHFEGPSEVYCLDLDTGEVERLTHDPAVDSNPRLIVEPH